MISMQRIIMIKKIKMFFYKRKINKIEKNRKFIY